MSFGGGGSGGGAIADATDVTLSNPATNDYFGFDGSTQKWENIPLKGKVALATGGGVEGLAALGSKTGATTLDLTTGNVFSATLTGNVTFTFSGATASTACSFGLYLKQDATGSRTVTWPTSAKWAGGTAPTLSTTANAMDILVFETIDGGTTWYGSLVGAAFA